MNKVDRTYKDTWERRKTLLNGMSYKEYLNSEHWKKVKQKALKRKRFKTCKFCDNKKIELHHTSYKWILTKNELRCIISLCRKHHEEIHVLARKEGCSVRIATNKIIKTERIKTVN